jgi:hypothetical protein
MKFCSITRHFIVMLACPKSTSKKGTTLDATLGCNPFKDSLAKSHKGTPTKEKGIPQRNRGIQTHDRVVEAKDNPMVGKEPQAFKDAPIKDKTTRPHKGSALKERVHEANKGSPMKETIAPLNKGSPTRENLVPQTLIVQPPLKNMANTTTIDSLTKVKALVEITQHTPSKENK